MSVTKFTNPRHEVVGGAGQFNSPMFVGRRPSFSRIAAAGVAGFALGLALSALVIWAGSVW